ncbi:MAG: hypothetical protein M0R75_14690 [Dehalococcoidia bacterium]|nr:hypothetical protein [Dehalococcoidia bacterium]
MVIPDAPAIRLEVIAAALRIELQRLAGGRPIQHSEEPVVMEGSLSIPLDRPIQESGRTIAVYGVGHRALYWREA